MQSITAFLLALTLAVGQVACGDDTADNNIADAPDVGVDASDAGTPDSSADADAEADSAMPDAGPTGGLCATCTEDTDCDDGLCLELFDGERVCGVDCASDADCPDDFTCTTIDAESMTQQCVPNNLTCIDRCADVDCSGAPTGSICDPLTGACRLPARLCSRDCQIDAQCGDGPEDRCLNVPGTPDNERACFTGCDPEAEVRECPADYFCAALDPENAPNEGICFPFQGTCVDRCENVTCGPGENCDPVTGGCVAAQFGACEAGCTSNAECGAQNDICLNLGIGDAPTCWQSCADNPEGCPAGYECLSVTATTLRLCIPTSRDCSLCADSACFPGGICNPDDGTCTDVPQRCSPGTCPTGQYCDPINLVCEQLGRPCSGDSWAIDCDNVVTKCTTQKIGAEGTCEQLCTTDADCDPGASCVNTSVGNLCLGYRDGGAALCGAAYDLDSRVGRPCAPGGCSGAAPTCVAEFGVEGFCSSTCNSDLDCDPGQVCEPGSNGFDTCLTVQCACAVSPELPAELELGLVDAFQRIDVSPCDNRFEPAFREANAYGTAGLSDPEVVTLASYPFRTLAARNRLSTAPTSLQGAWEAALVAAGRGATGTAAAPTYPGSNSKLAEAVAELVTATGGTPNLTNLDAEAASVPIAVQDVVAPYISAAARAYLARRNALGGSGWTATDIDAARAAAPFLFLPGDATDVAPDLTDPAILQRYEAFPRAEFEQIAADLASDLDAANATAAARTETGFGFDVTTPAGRVVIGDAGDTVHSDGAGPIAVLVDIGGNDTYTGAIAANASTANGVSIAVDFAGADLYSYTEVADPNDNANLLPSDADGRIAPSGPLFAGNGAVSASRVGRQAAAAFGIAFSVDLGSDIDERRSLRMSQASAIFGAAMLYDAGGDDIYRAEAFAQGAAMAGTALLFDAGGNDDYEIWHAGQAFATAGGAGFLFDADGDDTYRAVEGGFQAAGVLYYSPVDRGASNRNLAQGAASGVIDGVDGGLGVLWDVAGGDTYQAGTYAQGHGAVGGVGYLIDRSGGDTYEGRGYVQGTGEGYGGGVLWDALGDDDYNPTATRRQRGQGFGAEGGWGIIWDAAGTDVVNYIAPAGGAGIDGGLGIALFGPGDTGHDATSDASWGYAARTVTMGPFLTEPTRGIFIDAGGADSYARPDASIVVPGGSWLQPTVPASEAGYGADR